MFCGGSRRHYLRSVGRLSWWRSGSKFEVVVLVRVGGAERAAAKPTEADDAQTAGSNQLHVEVILGGIVSRGRTRGCVLSIS